MPAIGWELALIVWGYAIFWFLINDRVKLLGYRILDPEGEPVLGRPSSKPAGISAAN
jgi:H+-transporting ATPase